MVNEQSNYIQLLCLYLTIISANNRPSCPVTGKICNHQRKPIYKERPKPIYTHCCDLCSSDSRTPTFVKTSVLMMLEGECEVDRKRFHHDQRGAAMMTVQSSEEDS